MPERFPIIKESQGETESKIHVEYTPQEKSVLMIPAITKRMKVDRAANLIDQVDTRRPACFRHSIQACRFPSSRVLGNQGAAVSMIGGLGVTESSIVEGICSEN